VDFEARRCQTTPQLATQDIVQSSEEGLEKAAAELMKYSTRSAQSLRMFERR